MSSAGLFVELEHAREVQKSVVTVKDPKTGKQVRVSAPNATAPDLCFGASKFVAGKLAGLFRKDSHLTNLVLKCARAAGKDRIPPAEMNTAWGLFAGKDNFNKKLLGVSLKPESGVASSAWTLVDQPQFWFDWGNRYRDRADQLLARGVPIVAGVSLHGHGARDHFVCIVRHAEEGSVWLIDSWEDQDAATPGVFRLKNDFSFNKPVAIATDASAATRIPCNTMFLGYFLGRSTRRPFTAVEFGGAPDGALIRMS